MDWIIFTKHRTGIEQRSIENNKIFLVPYKISKFRINDFIVSLLRFVLMFIFEFTVRNLDQLQCFCLKGCSSVKVSFIVPDKQELQLVLNSCIHKKFDCRLEKCFLQFYFRIYFSMHMEYAPRMLIVIFRNRAFKTTRFMINLCRIHRKMNRAKMILK